MEMIKSHSKKLCIVVSSLGGGGAERSSAQLSELLYDLGYDIHIVSVLNKIDYPYKGQLLNLGELKSIKFSIVQQINFEYIFGSFVLKIGCLK